MLPKLNENFFWGIVLGLLAEIFSASGAYFVHACGPHISSGQILFVRSASAIIVLLPFSWARLGSILAYSARFVWLRSLFGAIAVGAYFVNLRFSSIGIATVFTNLAPIFVVIMSSVFLSERLRTIDLAGITCSFIGVLIFFLPGHHDITFFGVTLGLVSAVSGSFAYLSLKQVAGKYSALTVVFCFSIGMLIISLLDPSTYNIDLYRSDVFLFLGIVICSLGAQICITLSYKMLPTLLASNLVLTGCAWAILFDFALVGTRFSVPAIIAMLLITLGVVISLRRTSGKKLLPVSSPS